MTEKALQNQSTKYLLMFLGTLLICAVALYGICSYTKTQNHRAVNVSGQGIVKVQPDTLTISFSVQERADTAREAQTKIDEMTRNFVEAIQSIGVERRSIQTSNYSVWPNYYREPTSSRQMSDGFQASQQITVVLTQEGYGAEFVGLGERVISLAPTFGNVLINGSNFTVTNKAKGENDARNLAIAAAKQKAEQLAKGADAKLGRVHFISESISAGGFYPLYANARAMVSFAEDVAME
jgi:hypothetical protein